MLEQKVRAAIVEALGKEDFKLLEPRNTSFGDFAINIHQFADTAFSQDDILSKLQKVTLFEKVELAGTFVNVFVQPSILLDEINAIIADNDASGRIKNASPQRVSVEFGQPNTHKLPHIGHLFSYTYGESLARLLAFNGDTIYRSNYQGDIGLHVAKCLYIARQKMDEISDDDSLGQKAIFLQKCYQDGSAQYDANPEAKAGIDQLNKDIYAKKEDIVELWQKTRSWSIEYYKEFEARLGSTYDRYYFESETSEIGTNIVKEHVGKVFEESDGAIVFRGEPYGLHTRVFLTRAGTPTYEAKDIGLVKMKHDEWPFDKGIVTTASEQNAYWQVVKKAIELVFPDLEGKLMHFGFGMVDLKSGKMSSRTGNIISAIDLIDIVKNIVEEQLLAEGEKEAAEVIAVGAVKYAFLKSEAKKNISFDLEQSISIHGNSGPYLQYTYARLKSVMTKADYRPEGISESALAHLSDEDMALLRMIPRFLDVAQQAAESYAPHVLCTYVYELAQACNVLYDKQSIVKAEKEVQAVRLALLDAASRTLQTGLNLLGIKVLERI